MYMHACMPTGQGNLKPSGLMENFHSRTKKPWRFYRGVRSPPRSIWNESPKIDEHQPRNPFHRFLHNKEKTKIEKHKSDSQLHGLKQKVYYYALKFFGWRTQEGSQILNRQDFVLNWSSELYEHLTFLTTFSNAFFANFNHIFLWTSVSLCLDSELHAHVGSVKWRGRGGGEIGEHHLRSNCIGAPPSGELHNHWTLLHACARKRTACKYVPHRTGASHELHRGAAVDIVASIGAWEDPWRIPRACVY